jgi:hypothetical protein
MGAKRFEDLIAWQRANELKENVLAFIAKPPASNDRDYCDQIRKSARSAPANISEVSVEPFAEPLEPLEPLEPCEPT